ncbi:hypothetical protein SBRCBS47491_008479 [Sporothrix bragantina]|uniref:Zn(2)-C6 fungal-type domain-containing protein n=1 Tax=Sporothrix bragantina TaxID=671064 RepID=A0ABP0CPW3_9PEZI
MADSPDIAMMLDGNNFDDSPASGAAGTAIAAGAGPSNGDAVPPKRTRVLLSCAPCRISKLKCDREQPCGNCLKKDRTDLCEYAPRPKKPVKPAKGMAARLRRLEGMLREMMDDDSAAAAMSSFGVSSAELMASKATGGSDSSGANGAPSLVSILTEAEAEGYDGTGKPIPTTVTTTAPGAQPAPAPVVQPRGKGRVVRGQRATTYVGATHFMAMLDDIEDLKAYFEDPQEGGDDEWQEVSPALDAPEQLMLGGRQPRTKADLLALMPPRNVVDRLIVRYFGSNTPTQHTVHRPSFSRHYKSFWQDPANADVEFMAVLFIIMALGVHFSTYSAPHELELDGTNMSAAERYRLYRAAASAALALTRFSNPNLYTIRALLMFSESEFLVNRATQTNCFLLLAVCIRLMLKMGLHRDPSRLPTISAFEGEIRRRLWNLAIQIDLIVSFYMGLPSMIHGIPSDTSLAHNLLDEDFDEDSPSLPTPRPDSEYTVMSYPIFKSTICRIFGQVARLAHTLTPPKYAEVLRTDRLLEDKWRNIPAFMKVRPLGDCVADPPMQVVQRFGLASLYQKSRCVLHRPYLVEAVPLPEHAYSRRTCLQSALTLLAYHEAIHEATQPGGLLYHIGWFITGLGMHDFLLAAMIVYLVVQNDNLFESELVTNGNSCSSSTATTGSDSNKAGVSGFHMDTGPAPTPSTGPTSVGPDIPTVSSSSSGASGTSGPTTSSSGTGIGTGLGDGAAPSTAGSGITVSLPVSRSMLIDLLRRSYHIWADVSEKNNDTIKAADLLSVMLRKIYAREIRENGSPPNWEPPVDHRQEADEQAPQTQQQQQPPSPGSPGYISRPNDSVFAGGYGHGNRNSNADINSNSNGSSNINSVSGGGGGIQPSMIGGIPPLSESTLRSLGVQETTMSGHLPVTTASSTVGNPLTDNLNAPMGFSRRDLVPPSQLPAGATNNLAAPSRYDSWIPLSLDALDWGNVDTGIRVINSQENEWSTADSAVLNDINYAAAGMWDQPDAAPQ